MRSEFEKLPQIENHLHNVVFDEGLNEYLAKKMGHLPFEFSEWFLNGSWTIYQHQQSKMDELQKRVDAVKRLAQTLWEKSEKKHQQGKVWESKTLGECADEILDVLEQALKCSEE